MIIVLEGLDKTGKSTLAAELHRRLGYPVSHEGPPPHITDPDYLPGFEYYMKTIRELPDHAICDRLFHGELVYGPLWRNEYAYQPWQLPELEAELGKRKHVIVYCRADRLDVMSRIEQDVEANDLDVFVFENIGKFISAYEDLAAQLDGCLSYDSSRDSPGDCAERIISTLGLDPAEPR
jgi:thymidylate kinase